MPQFRESRLVPQFGEKVPQFEGKVPKLRGKVPQFGEAPVRKQPRSNALGRLLPLSYPSYPSYPKGTGYSVGGVGWRRGKDAPHRTYCARGQMRLNPRCDSCQIEYFRAWRNGPGREQYTQRTAESHARYPERVRARAALRAAVRRGKITRGPCEACGTRDDIHAHHDDYTRPLDVRWVCRAHHSMLDRQRRQASAA